MSEESVDLLREQALSFLAVAVVRWAEHHGDSGAKNPAVARTVLAALNQAAAHASRLRAMCGSYSPLTPGQLVAALSRPVSEWLVGVPEEALLEAGEPTPWCEDLAQHAGSDPAAEVEQQILLAVMANLGRRANGAELYTRFRRFLIDNPVVAEDAARALAIDVGVPFSRLYEPIGLECLPGAAQEPSFYPCPCCGWPMRISTLTGRIACRADRCQRAGARFLLREEKLLPMGRYHPPAPQPADGVVRLRRGVWRYTLQPGLAERDLAERLQRIPGVQVALWPELDLYDLDVRYGEQRWRVDVKDHHSARALAAQLRAREPREPIYIVVPNDRKDQRQLLTRLCGTNGAYRFHTSSSFLQLVRKVVRA